MKNPDDLASDEPKRLFVRFACALMIVIASSASLADLINSKRSEDLPFYSANDRSRWLTVWALVERNTYQIDEIHERPGWSSIDIVRWKGHFYSSKPALLPTLVAGIYSGVRSVTGWTLDEQPHAVVSSVLFFVNWLPWTIALCLIASLALRYARTGTAAIFVVAAAAFATFLSPYLVTFNNHSVAAWSVVFAIYPAINILVQGKDRAWWYALSGLFSAFVVTNELPAAAFGAAMFLLLLRRSWKLTWLCFVPAALIPLGGFFYTTYLASGGFIPFYAYFGTEVYEYVHKGVPSYWMRPRGIDVGAEPRWSYFLNCLIGHHGIFSLSPIFALSVVGWLGSRRWREFPLRLFSWLGAGLTVWMMIFIMYKTNNYGGNTSGLRWVFWLIPFWLIAMLPVIDEWGHRRAFRTLCGLLLAISVYSVAYSRENPWSTPWAMNTMQHFGWADYSTPRPAPEKTLNCWIPSLPAQPEGDAQKPFVVFTAIDKLGQAAVLKLISEEQKQIDGQTVRQIRVQQSSGYGNAKQAKEDLLLLLDEQQIAAGGDPQQCLLWPEPTSERQKRIAEIFLQGMPGIRQYYPSRTRYLFTPLADDAIECRTAVSQIRYTPRETGRTVIYRRTVWLSDRVPFGVVQFEDTVTDEQTNELLYTQQMTISEASDLAPAETPPGETAD